MSLNTVTALQPYRHITVEEVDKMNKMELATFTNTVRQVFNDAVAQEEGKRLKVRTVVDKIQDIIKEAM